MDSHSAAMNLVLVDDDPAVRSALTFAFEVDGFAVQAFDSAESALAAEPSPAACWIIDQRLPGRSGLELLKQLRSGGATTPAILITTHPRPALKAQAEALKADVIEKPLLTNALVEAVRGLLAAAPRAS